MERSGLPRRERERTSRPWSVARALALAQGGFYIAAGIWPVVHYRSFTAVTGPKREGWLVKTTGLLFASIGVGLLTGARAHELRAVGALGLASAATTAAIDFVYTARRRISPVYLVDGAVELAVALSWIAIGARRRLRRRQTAPA